MDDSGMPSSIDESEPTSSQEMYGGFQGSDVSEGPVIMAAGLQDQTQLNLLLEKALLLSQKSRSQYVLNYTPAPDLGWGMELPSPLLRAIERHVQRTFGYSCAMAPSPMGFSSKPKFNCRAYIGVLLRDLIRILLRFPTLLQQVKLAM